MASIRHISTTFALGAIAAVAMTPGIASASTTGTSSTLLNGGFEQPAITAKSWSSLDASAVPGWSTTATDNKIEIWNNYLKSPSEGNQLAELNANMASNLYQDLTLTPGATYTFGVDHLARCSANDVAAVQVGAPGSALTTLVSMSDSSSKWGHYSGSFTVPTGQNVTRFQLTSVSNGCGNASEGNLVDNVTLSTANVDLPLGGTTGYLAIVGFSGVALVAMIAIGRRRMQANPS